VPWANMTPNPELLSWLKAHAVDGTGQRALVVGCGLGDDAEALDAHGFNVTAFDISSEAIRWARQRFPDSKVHYKVADLFAAPDAWNGSFDFVFECYTLQSLPAELRSTGIKIVAGFVAPTGQLLIVARGRDSHEDKGELPPWPLTHEELNKFMDFGLTEVSFEDYLDAGPTRRFRILYRR